MISNSDLDYFIDQSLNVCLRGKHGVGKTAQVLQAFNRHKLNWLYFSASTMDVWCDMIGIPKEKTDANGLSYLELIRPKCFAEDKVEAIFMDEFNRAPKKCRNSVMELIQFKSINGKKFNNLKLVWTAINPDDDEDNKYDVEPLDPAQLDRFHIIVDVPYTPSVPYFRSKYGTELANSAISWWKDLTKEQKDAVSPRRLDYMLNVYKTGGDVRFVLPKEVNTNKLLTELMSGPISENLKALFVKKCDDETQAFLGIENNYAASVDRIIKSPDYINYFIPLLSSERIISLMNQSKKIEDFVFDNASRFKDIVILIRDAQSGKLYKRANKVASKLFVPPLVEAKIDPNAKVRINPSVSLDGFKSVVQGANGMIKWMNNGGWRYYVVPISKKIGAYEMIRNSIPSVLDYDAAYTALKCLYEIADHSNTASFKKMPELGILIQHFHSFLINNKMKTPIPKNKVENLNTKLGSYGLAL